MNRTLLIACLFVISLAAVWSKVVQGQAAASSTKPEDQVGQLERDWLAADGKGDTATLRRIVADDFIGQFDGPVLAKDDIIPQSDSRGEFAGATPTGTNVRVFGDTAVLMGSIRTADPVRSADIRVALVCQKRARGWQIIAAHLAHAAEQQ